MVNLKKSLAFNASLLFIITAACILFSCKQKERVSGKSIDKTLLLQIDSFNRQVDTLTSSVKKGNFTESRLQEQFLLCRKAFKKIEWAAEYFQPAVTRTVNGPPVQEVEMPELKVMEPAGLQILEGYFFPRYDPARKKEILGQLGILNTDGDLYLKWFSKNRMYDFQVFDAARLEVFRIMTLGITGFDNPLSLKSMPESAAALESLQTVFDFYKSPDEQKNVGDKLEAAVKYLLSHPDFNAFNRMEFIVDYGNPLTTGIQELQEALKIKYHRYNRLLNQDAKTIFDSNAFNVNAYAPDHSSFITIQKVNLGKMLFADPVLSGSANRSCRTCHQPGKAFTDGLSKNVDIETRALLERNTPTLVNAALQPSLFYDLRVNSLEEQSHSVVQSIKEMHGSMLAAGKKLWQKKKYRELFIEAYPNEDKSRIDTFEIMNALGSYIRSLTLLNSRFDEYMRGNRSALDDPEIRGFNLFMGKAKCATCHYMPLFNGNFPPRFVKMETEVIGVPKIKGGKEIDSDPGRFDIVPVESLRHSFKIPTVRNAARTAPYMHNGVFASLEDVLDFYNGGGGFGLGIKTDNQTLPPDSLNLTGTEKQDIMAFIKSLDSKMPFEKN